MPPTIALGGPEIMCANQPSHVSKVLIRLKDWGRAWGWIAGFAGLIIGFVSLSFAISSNHIAKRAMAPSVVATGTRFKATPDPNIYTLEVYFLQKDGKEDVSAITLTAVTMNLTTKEMKKLADSEKFARLSAARWEASKAILNIRKTDLLNILVICISYSDESSDNLEPNVNFYAVPDRPPVLNGTDAVPQGVPAEEREMLSSGFSCAKLAK
jgi:hypothetical protein